MDYEKKYKDALANARQEYNTTENVERKQWLEELFPELGESENEMIRKELIRETKGSEERLFEVITNEEFIAWLENQGNPNKEYHRVPSTTLKRLYMNEAKYELLKSDIMEGIVGDFEKGTTHSYLTIKIPMLSCPSNCAKGDKVKLIIVREE